MPAGISYAVGVFHAQSAFHKSTKWIYFSKKSIDKVDAFFWSEWRDLNSRPLDPQ